MAEADEESPVRAPLPTATFVTSVARVEPVAHPFVRVTFGGGDLARFRTVGPDQFVYLLLPPPGRDRLTIDAGFVWDQYRSMAESERPVGAYYTVRHHRPEVAELDIDVLLHSDPGPASRWAETALPGDEAALWGPRTAYAPPPGTAWQLLLGDETALPAIGSILETLPPASPVTVLLELDEWTELDLPAIEYVEVVRLAGASDRASEGGVGSRLVGAVRELEFRDAAAYVWGGGEFEAMGAVRRHLREERGLGVKEVGVVGYWR